MENRSLVINKKKAFGLLRDPAKQLVFDNRLCDVIATAQFKVVCVAIDKQKYLQQYSSSFHPYHYCLAALLDRYSGWLNYRNAVGDVMAEARGAQEDRQLEQAYQRVYESGTLMLHYEHHQRALTSRDLKLRKKIENIAGLQLADLLAHPMKNWLLAEKGHLQWGASPFAARLLELVRPKLNCHATRGDIDGYGTVEL